MTNSLNKVFDPMADSPQPLARYLAARTNEVECNQCADTVLRVLRNQSLANHVRTRLIAVVTQADFAARGDLDISEAVSMWMIDGFHQEQLTDTVAAIICAIAVTRSLERGDGINFSPSALRLASVARSFDMAGLVALFAFANWAFQRTNQADGSQLVVGLLMESCFVTMASTGALLMFGSLMASYALADTDLRRRFLDERDAGAWAEHLAENEEAILLSLRLRRGAGRLVSAAAIVRDQLPRADPRTVTS